MYCNFRGVCTADELLLDDINGDDEVTYIPIACDKSDVPSYRMDDHYYSWYTKHGEVVEVVIETFFAGTPDELQEVGFHKFDAEEAQKMVRLFRECGIDC